MPKYKNDVKRAILLFALAMLLSMVGLESRNLSSLSLFWPFNAIMLGLLIRFPLLDTRSTLLVIFPGMLSADLLYGTPPIIAAGLDMANLLFIACARSILLSSHFTRPHPRRLQALLNVFPASLVGAATCALAGAIVSKRYFEDELLKAWFSWFSEQMSTSILLLPLVISLPRRDELSQMLNTLRECSALPLLALIATSMAGIWIGGGGSMLFPLPALLWCAISYPLFVTCFLTMIIGISEIILVASNVLNIQGKDDLLRIDSLSSARLGVAAMLISPLIVAISSTSNKKLVARLTQRADYDLLTGALTRSGLASKLETLMTPRHRPDGFFGAVFVIDIDRFKNINDTFGHAAGDFVLAKTVECIHQSLHQTALISRMGGEEFLVLIEGVSQARAFLLANHLRQSIEQNRIVLNGDDLSVTVSIGISSVNLKSVKSLDESINKADEELYIAKSSGRNQVRPEFIL